VTAAKPAGYYASARADLVAALPRPLGRVLDVGCGSGASGPLMQEAGATTLTGIEPEPAAAARARELYDDVVEGTVEAALATLAGPWDTICCYDVLEHLVDPLPVLRELHARAAPGAHLHVSLPNARHVSLVWDLVVRGTFGYTAWGHRDSTHLRWFTRSDIVAVLRDAGWRVVATSHPALRHSRALDRVTGGRSTEFLVGQWYVLAAR
jgi:2-polyprenyl-3-methyl-5-hydroxy-6-metoxy-1,4-benzoquinol methylase